MSSMLKHICRKAQISISLMPFIGNGDTPVSGHLEIKGQINSPSKNCLKNKREVGIMRERNGQKKKKEMRKNIFILKKYFLFFQIIFRILILYTWQSFRPRHHMHVACHAYIKSYKYVEVAWWYGKKSNVSEYNWSKSTLSIGNNSVNNKDQNKLRFESSSVI